MRQSWGWGEEGDRVENEYLGKGKSLNKILFVQMGSFPKANNARWNLASLSLSEYGFKNLSTQTKSLSGAFSTPLTLFTYVVSSGNNFLLQSIKVKDEIFGVCSCPFSEVLDTVRM